MRRLLGRWLCRRGHHDLKPLRGDGMVNAGACRRCGVIQKMSHGYFFWIGPS